MKPLRWPSKPCANCPFTKGGVDLRPGRVDALLRKLEDDQQTFHCHKTLHARRGCRAGCAGSNILALRTTGLSVAARLASLLGLLDLPALKAHAASDACRVFSDAEGMRRYHREVDAGAARGNV